MESPSEYDMATVKSSNDKECTNRCQHHNRGDDHPRITLSKVSRVHSLIICHYYKNKINRIFQGLFGLIYLKPHPDTGENECIKKADIPKAKPASGSISRHEKPSIQPRKLGRKKKAILTQTSKPCVVIIRSCQTGPPTATAGWTYRKE